MISNVEHSVSLHLIPQKIRENYSDFVLSHTTSYSQNYLAKSNADGLTYSVRVFDTESEFTKGDLDRAVTLFLQEIIFLCTKLGNFDAIKLEHFAISGGQIGFVTLPASLLQDCVSQGKEYKIEQLLEDLKGDLSFLRNSMKFKVNDVHCDDVYRTDDRFFLGDWAKLSFSAADTPTESLLRGLVEEVGKLGHAVNNSENLMQCSERLKVAWCSLFTNNISIYDMGTQTLSHVQGAEITEGII